MNVSVSLPWPPSANVYYRTVLLPAGKGGKARGKFAPRVLLSSGGRRYREACSREVYSQRIPRRQLTGKLEVTITAYPPDRRARDIDNLFKGLLDALKHTQVIRDDADIDRLSIQRGPILKGGVIELRVSEIAGEATVSGELFDAA